MPPPAFIKNDNFILKTIQTKIILNSIYSKRRRGEPMCPGSELKEIYKA